jgi:hypothetical protein
MERQMRLLGGFSQIDGRAALALFAAPVLASAWVFLAPPRETVDKAVNTDADETACAAEPRRAAGRAAEPQQTGGLRYRNGEMTWAPGPRALTAEWIWLKVREARMIAERSDHKDLDLPPELAKLASDPAWAQAIASERAILQARRATHYGFERELGKRLIQIRGEHDTLQSLAKGRKRERELLNKELNGIAYLHKRGLATTGRLVSLQRDVERLKADEAQLKLDAERVLARAGEVELELLRRNGDRQIEIADGLRMIETRFAEIEDMRGAPGAAAAVGHEGADAGGALILASAPGQPCGDGE